MATVNLTFRNATNSWQATVSAEEEETIEQLGERLVASLNLPMADERSQLGQVIPMAGESVSLYHPRRGILDPQKNVDDYSSLYNDPWVVYVKYELADLLSSLHLATERSATESSRNPEADNRFHTLVRLATVKWEDGYYPILLPAQATPQGHIEGSLLNTVVVQQINHIRRVVVDPARLPDGHYYNLNTKREIDPFDQESLIGTVVNHGDLLEYRTSYPVPHVQRGGVESDSAAPELDIVILERPQEQEPDANLLDSITISPIEENS